MKNVQIALKLYSPYLSLLPESPAEWFNHRLNRRVRDYRFLIKLILWSEPFYRKIGPRVLWLLGSSLIPVFFSLPKK